MRRTSSLIGLAIIVCVVYLVWNYMGVKDTAAGKAVGRVVLNPGLLVEDAIAGLQGEMRPTTEWGSGAVDPSTGESLLAD